MSISIEVIQVTPFYQNCRLLIDENKKEAVVCDVGGSADKIAAYLKLNKIELKAILTTHAHPDHMGQAALLHSMFPNAILLGPHRDDLPLIEALNSQGMFGMEVKGFAPEFLDDGQSLNLMDELSFKVLHTPGHTPGGICFYSQEHNMVLVGDTLFECSVGRTDFPMGNSADLIASIKTKLYTLPDSTVVLSGHGHDTTIGQEKLHNPYTAQ